MGRRRKGGRALDGWIALDKPLGLSSAAAVAAVRRITGAAKAGHGGTLDPLATGLLPIALGEATKTVAFVMDGAKTYRFAVRWGEARSTDDAEGEVVAVSDRRPADAAAIEAVLPRFVGRIRQIPPVYSALKVEGARAYALARAGEAPTMTPRDVEIRALRLLDLPDAGSAVFEADVGKGTYIRALARDVASALGTVGYVTQLRRTRVGRFDERIAIPLDRLAAIWQGRDPTEEHLLPVETALDDIPALAVTEAEALHLGTGRTVLPVALPDRDRSLAFTDGATVLALAPSGHAVALTRFEGGRLRPVRVFNRNSRSPDVDHGGA